PTLSLVPPTYAVAPPPLTPSPPPSLHDALPIWVGTAVAVLLTRAGHQVAAVSGRGATTERAARWLPGVPVLPLGETAALGDLVLDRKSTRLNSSHEWISYAVFCLKKKKA